MNIVHIMKKAITTKEKIRENAKKEARSKGLEKIGMREISSASSVALGTLYKYFPDKESLIIATISSIWNETIGNLKKPEGFVSALSVFMMLTRGTLEVIGLPLSSALDASISGIAGIGHILLGTGLILLFVSLRKAKAK